MSTFAIDVDGTLYDFSSEVREAFFELSIEEQDKDLLKGAYSGYHEWRELIDSLGRKHANKAIEWVHERCLEQIPFKNSAKVVRKIAKHYDVKYVTGRQDKHAQNTQIWLTENGFPTGELICTTKEKKEFLWDCQYLIDDRPKTILEFVYDFTWKFSHGSENKKKMRQAFGLWNPYNRNLTDVRNVLLAPTWRGIAYYLERRGLI